MYERSRPLDKFHQCSLSRKSVNLHMRRTARSEETFSHFSVQNNNNKRGEGAQLDKLHVGGNLLRRED